ncbi:MAG: hypothetical protein HY863_20045 [Chloroflexi bacterium]|nr:hypothetical protein [Chloroflexota bacterium]
MFKNLKNILIGVLSAVIVIAIGASAYSAFASPNNNTTITSDTALPGNGNNGNTAGAASQDSNGQSNGAQGSNGQGSGGQGTGTGIPQADISGATTVHGIVNSVDLTGMSVTLDDGTILYVDLGNSRYIQSIGFAPTIGEGLAIYGFQGDQGLYSAITVTVDSTSAIYTFRSETGQPLWSGGNGNGQGGGHGNGGGNRP